MNERRRRFDEKMSKLQSDAQGAACPIYGIKGTTGGLVGSSFMLRVCDETLLVTAAHVFYKRHAAKLHVPGDQHPVQFEGRGYFSGTREFVEHPDFGLDIGCVHLNYDSA